MSSFVTFELKYFVFGINEVADTIARDLFHPRTIGIHIDTPPHTLINRQVEFYEVFVNTLL